MSIVQASGFTFQMTMKSFVGLISTLEICFLVKEAKSVWYHGKKGFQLSVVFLETIVFENKRISYSEMQINLDVHFE